MRGSTGKDKGGKRDGKQKDPNAKKQPKGRGAGRSFGPRNKKPKGEPLPNFSDEVRLNKYLSNTGICSRREADTLIATGVVTVNGEIITEMGFKVKPGDVVKYDGESIKPNTKRYVLLNKPKDFVATNTDAWGRKSVMALIANACKEPILPVDKLDRETKGLLLFTNDHDLAKKLTHPNYKAAQIYHVQLSKSMQPEDMKLLEEEGVFLDTGKVKADKVSYVEGKSNHEIGIEIRSNKNKIVHRILESLGYNVLKLDRVAYGGLSKKDLPRGKYRHLTDNEVSFLKMS